MKWEKDNLIVLADWQREGRFDLVNRIYSSSSSSPTLTKVNQGVMVCSDVEEKCGDLIVNVLTPSECWRLMGQPYWAYNRVSKVCSETQLYNQAGNSIVVEVLMAIFSAMFGTKGARNEQSTLMRWGVLA